jgi:cellulose biosynthesis protein BcsQ
VATALGSAVAAVRDRLVASQARPDLAALGQELVRRHSLIVVALNTKGGVGKTTNCSALALLGGKAVEPHGGSAVFIDANPTNPNGRAKLGLQVDTPGLRALIDALATGAVPPAGARLKGYRAQAFTGAQGSGFGRAEVRRVAAHLRTVFTLIVVDLANAYPSLSGGPSGESAHHWLQEADVVLVPTDPDENTFEGAGETIDAVEEMAEAAGKPRPPIVVSFLVRPRGEALREPGIRECLAHLNESGIPVVPVPNIERIALASWRKEQVTEVSPQANRAWEQVLAAIVSAEPEQEQGR